MCHKSSAKSPVFQAQDGGRSWIRTSEGVSQQIYSLPPLATWVSYHSAKSSHAPKAAHHLCPDTATPDPLGKSEDTEQNRRVNHWIRSLGAIRSDQGLNRRIG